MGYVGHMIHVWGLYGEIVVNLNYCMGNVWGTCENKEVFIGILYGIGNRD